MLQDHQRAMHLALAEVETLEAFRTEVLPALTKAIEGSSVIGYRMKSPTDVTPLYPDGFPDLMSQYFAHFVDHCPLHAVKLGTDAQVVPTTRLAGNNTFKNSAVFNELMRPWDLDHHLVLRFNSGTDELGLLLHRGRHQGEHTPEMVADFEAVAPMIAAAMARAARYDDAKARLESLETVVLGEGRRARIVVDANGRVLHVSPGAFARLDPLLVVLRNPASPIRLAIASLLRGLPASTILEIEPEPGEVLRAELEINRRLDSARSVVVVRVSCVASTRKDKSWSELGLTPAEIRVLEELVAGRSNAEIGARLFVSAETVRTHLTRIFKKMNVRSRLEAVVKAKAV